MPPRAVLDRGLGELALELPPGAPKSDAYGLLATWNKTYNCTAIRDPLQAVSHHVLDSLSVLREFLTAAARSPMSARAAACPASHWRSPNPRAA